MPAHRTVTSVNIRQIPASDMLAQRPDTDSEVSGGFTGSEEAGAGHRLLTPLQPAPPR